MIGVWPGSAAVIIDTSAIVAILRQEPDAARCAAAIEAAGIRRMSAATYVEIGSVIDGARDPTMSPRAAAPGSARLSP